jgi:hypothetical protein
VAQEPQERRSSHNRANSTWEGGPTYADARAQAQELEEETGLRVGFLLEPENVQHRWSRGRMHVRAWLSASGPWEPGTYWAGVPLGGNSGTRTLPAAMVRALTELHQRWWDAQDETLAEPPLRAENDETRPRKALSLPFMG